MRAFAYTPEADKPESLPAEDQASLFSIPPTRSLTAEQVSFMTARLQDEAQQAWEALVLSASQARKRAGLLAKLTAPELREHPSRTAHLHRAVAIELDLRRNLGVAAVTEFWADATWRALTPSQREGGAAEAWGVPADRERLTAVVWTDWPAFSWPAGFDWADEVGHSGWHEVAVWLRATGKSPPNPPRLGPALQLAIAEGLKV